MEALRHVVVLVHLVGFAILFGAWAVQAFGGGRSITRYMNIGMVIAAVTGIALAAPWGIEGDMNYIKIGVKLLILLVIAALLGIGGARQRKTGSLPAGIFWPIGVLTILNAGIAVLWV